MQISIATKPKIGHFPHKHNLAVVRGSMKNFPWDAIMACTKIVQYVIKYKRNNDQNLQHLDQGGFNCSCHSAWEEMENLRGNNS